MLFQKYLQRRYQTKGMYPVTVMLFCVGLSVRNGQKTVLLQSYSKHCFWKHNL